MIERVQKEIETRLLAFGADVVGFADISDVVIPGREELRTAVAIGIAYDPMIVETLDDDPEAFENHLADNKKTMAGLLSACEQLLGKSGFAAWKPPISTNLPGLLSDFPHKTAATKAGLGWIGKSALFVSSEFGPGVRLASVLTDAPFATGAPVADSRCGTCMECAEACPCEAIKGEQWHAGIARDELLDAFLCSKKREAHIPIQACPFGRKHARHGAQVGGEG
jgi:epoxyqueuosine reductase QueG